ncbi:MAG: SxtJ family membrane protein, partial [Planctomycetaceae bacterium]
CAFAPRGFGSFRRGLPPWLQQKLHVGREIRNALGGEFQKSVLFAEHHESHAASAFFPSPYEDAAVLTIDGVGEWATATCGAGRANRVALTHELRFPHSLGLLYSAFTHYCGFEVDAGEYKLMGLAPYGEPKYADLILERLVDVKPDGSLRLDLSYFNYCYGLTMTSSRFHRLLGGPPRRPSDPIEERHLDVAASIQRVTEEILLRMARHVHELTGLRKLCLAGGVALNCVANSRILREGPFDELWIQPAAGDAGGALGAALLVWHQLLGNPRAARSSDKQEGSFLGPGYSTGEVRACLQSNHAVFHELPDAQSVMGRTAALLAEQKVVGWMQERMEFGPRALGNRSVLADARDPVMQRVLNQKIKFRESFRPFAPIVLAERTDEFFEMPRGQRSPYMLLVADVAKSKRREIPDGGGLSGLDKLHVVRSEIAAVTHVDNSARVQSVDEVRHPMLTELLRAFQADTGCPVLINTSFNVKDEPIVCSPQDAYECFLKSGLDALVIDSYLLLKEEQPGCNVASQKRVHEAQSGGWLGRGDASLAEIVHDPTPRQLRTFGWGLTIVPLVLWTVTLAVTTQSETAWWSATAAATVLALVYFGAPRFQRPILRTWMIATYPLSWLGSQAALAVAYYLVLSPIGVCLRLFGRDSMSRRFDPSAESYWESRRPPADQGRYLRQF